MYRNLEWDNFHFKDFDEVLRAEQNGYAVVTFNYGTNKQYDALIEFELDGKTPIQYKYPVSYLKHCLEENLQPSVYAANKNNSNRDGPTTGGGTLGLSHQEIISTPRRIRINTFEDFRVIYGHYVVVQIRKAKETRLNSVDLTVFGLKEASNDVLKEIEIFLLKQDIEDVEFSTKGMKFILTKESEER